MKDEKLFEGIYEEVVDDLYVQYELDHSMKILIHKNPGALLSKEEFAKTLEVGGDEKWRIGCEVLFSYIARLRKRAATQSDQMKQL